MDFLGKVTGGLFNVIAPVIAILFYGVIIISMLAIFLAIFILPPVLILRLPQWITSHREGSCIKIKYSTFISMYNMKPHAWELEDDTVFYKKKTYDNGWSHETKTHFCFDSYIDYYRYRRFLKKVLKEEDLKELKFMEEKNYEELEKVLDHWKSDIKEYKKNSDAEIKKKLKELGVLGD